MLFPWIRDYRRERLREAPFPERWLVYLHENVPHYAELSATEQEMLRGDLRIFIQEKHWEGCGGLELTDEIRVTIAAQACLLTLALPEKYFPNVTSILVYPSGYRAKVRHVGPAGVVTESFSHRLGEAWQDGPVVLSWQDSHAGGRNAEDGHNVVLHEFAHKLDMTDGRPDGYPWLDTDEEYRRWFEVMKAEYDRLREEGEESVLDPYGAKNAAELFAVSTEAFFEKPRQLLGRHPALYQMLRDYYRQDPAERLLLLREESL